MKTVLLYEYANGQVYPGIVVSPAPASEIQEPTIPGVEELALPILIGAGLGMATFGLASVAGLAVPIKLLIAGGAFWGSALLTNQAMKGTGERKLRFQMSPAPASQVHCPTHPRVEEV